MNYNRDGLLLLGNFDDLAPASQDARLREIESTTFFALLRRHTIEGMFCDPMHGGNAGMIGWQLIGYPGPQMSWASHIDRHHGQPFRPKPVSLSDAVGRLVTPWEESE